MNFFEQQDQARQQSKLLIGLFGLGVAGITGCIYLATVTTMGLSPLSGGPRCVKVSLPEPIAVIAGRKSSRGSLGRSGRSRSNFGSSSSGSSSRSNFGSSTNEVDFFRPRRSRTRSSYTERNIPCVSGKVQAGSWWHPQILFWVTLITSSVIGAASLYKISQLQAGGAVIAQELGGQLLVPEHADPQGRQLLNVVEEMAIAAGIPVPSVYLLEQEGQINAFAAGFHPENAVIGVTRGSLDQLTRDELQGVIGHEFSHILNGDMRLNIQLMGLLHGILFIYISGRVLLSDTSDRNPLWGFGFALLGIGSIGLLCGRLIQSAVSRQREFLADASAVQFTRNPAGIGGALEKLAGIGSQLQSPHAQAASHMFFGNAMKLAWTGDWFATHPPLLKRIERIRGVKSNPQVMSQQSSTGEMARAGMMGFAGATVSPERVVQQVGTVTPDHYAHAQGLLAQVPENIRLALREPEGAIALLYALFLDAQQIVVQVQQMQSLEALEAKDFLTELFTLLPTVQSLDPRFRLPLLDLAIPALRQAPAERLQEVFQRVEDLANADGTWSLTEFVLFLVLQRRLEAQRLPGREVSIQYTTLPPLLPDCFMLLSALASAGSPKPEAIAYGFRCGAFKLPGVQQDSVPTTPPPWLIPDLPNCLERLRQAAPKLKQAVVNACAHTVLLDSEVTIEEAELLRAIVITLDCPMPPFLNAVRSPKSSPS